MEVRPTGVLEYFVAFSQCRTPLSDFYVNTAGTGILGAWDEEGNMGIGFLIYEQKGTFAEILCLECIRQKTGTEERLLQEFLDLGKRESMETILFRLSRDSSWYPRLKELVEKNGFTVKEKLYLFRSYMEDYSRWKEYRRKHGERILRFLAEEGFQAMPFCEAPDGLLEEVIRDPDGRFDKMLDPARVIQGRKGPFHREISYLSVKEGHPAAYCLVTSPGREQCVFEIISAAEEYQNTGVVFQSFCLAMDALENRPYKRIAFAIAEENKKAVVLSKRIMKALIRHTNIQYNYEYDYKETGRNLL